MKPGRRSRPRREHWARLVPSYHAFGIRAVGGMLAGSRPVPRHGGIMRPSCGNRWSGKDGTAVGIGAVTFDDGTPLGSASGLECRIDSIAQSWGVNLRAANPVRAAIAMAAVDEYLVRRDEGLVLLFTPPFDQTPLDPGYIKGYSARHTGERRPIHTRGNMVGARFRNAR